MSEEFSDAEDNVDAESEQHIADNPNISSWQRLKSVCISKGPLGWQRAAERYHRYAKGRIFLSPRDALKFFQRRKWDYAFASFLRTGAINGTLAALYVGCMVAAITHVTAWRGHFSLWTVPAITISVPSIIACRLGLRKMVQAANLGLTCGLTLSLIVFSVSYFSGQTIDDIYQQFKREYELMLSAERVKDENIKMYQKEHNIWSKGLAKHLMDKDKRMDSEISENSPE